ncbi:hypothetical protein F4818DRAFT_418121 [Hypoxylon cercidicola]|nr:hypothetical protein F4818DRAFT_418121 [Hypoxylon cercidicola]
MADSSPTMRAARPAAPSRLLTLPLELRLNIYEEVIIGSAGSLHLYSGVITEHSRNLRRLSYRTSVPLRFPINLLLTCEQIHSEVASIVYRRVIITISTFSFPMWFVFFCHIGPRYGALIQDLKIACPLLHFLLHFQRRNIKRWDRLFDSLSYAKVSPTSLKLEVGHIEHYDFQLLPGISLVPIFKNLPRCFENIQRLELQGLFESLWGFYLRKRFGFVIKRYRPMTTQDGLPVNYRWELIHPTFFDPGVDLRHFSPSGSIEGIYDENESTVREIPQGPGGGMDVGRATLYYLETI